LALLRWQFLVLAYLYCAAQNPILPRVDEHHRKLITIISYPAPLR
jgi:hypothetical protein